MTNDIRTYEDLLEEKARLKLLLSAQKDLVRADINDIKQELIPVRKALGVVGKFTSRENRNSMLTLAADTAIDMLVRRVFLAKAGFFTRMIVPFIMKNFSSHVIAENKEKILSKIASLFGKAKENGTAPHADFSYNTNAGAEEQED